MVSGPQIEIPIRLGLDLPTPREQPIVIKIRPAENHRQQVEQVRFAQMALYIVLNPAVERQIEGFAV
jgi:hypothetical protein